MKQNEKVVILLCGYTKVRKSTLSRIFSEIINCDVFEMSEPFIKLLPTNLKPSLSELLKSLADYRKEHGNIALAEGIFRKIQKSKKKVIIVAGLRSFADYNYLKEHCINVYTIYIHANAELRHLRLTKDPSSIAKGEGDYSLLDQLTYQEGLRYIVPYADFVFVNEPGFPLTSLEQVKMAYDRLHKNFGVNLKSNMKEIIMNSDGVIIKKLPIYDENHAGKKDIIGRVIKAKGELTTISTDEINYLAYVEFPIDGKPRANHFHEEKIEYLYLIKGKVKLFYRRGGQPDDEVQEITVEEGSLIYIQPGFAHAYITIETGLAVEFSPTSYETIKKDKVRDYVIKARR